MYRTLLTALFLCLLILPAGAPAQDADFIVVINAANPATEMESSKISKMFLKKVKRWESGEPVLPVDQDEKSPVRKAFTEAIHGKKVSAIKSYWQRMIFSGRDVPPAALNSDQAVIDFVAKDPGAISYVTSGIDLGSDVKELKVTE